MDYALHRIHFDRLKRADETKVGDRLSVVWRDAFDPPFIVAEITHTTYQGLPALRFRSEPGPGPSGPKTIFYTECAPYHMVEAAAPEPGSADP